MKKKPLTRALATLLALFMIVPSIMPMKTMAMDSDIVVLEENITTQNETESDEITVIEDAEALEEASVEEMAANEEADILGEEESSSNIQIEVNQGMSIHISDARKPSETYMNDFVAKKATAIMIKIPGSDEFDKAKAEEAVKKYSIQVKAVTNGQEADNNELVAAGDSMDVKQAYDKDSDGTKGWYAVANFPTGPDKGTYNIHWQEDGKDIATNNGVNFYETNTLNILMVPVKAYWGKMENPDSSDWTFPEGLKPTAETAYSCTDDNYTGMDGSQRAWSNLKTDLKEYLLDVYPIADVNIEEGQEIDASDPSYDMITSDGQKKLWEEACKLQTKDKETGKDKYDLILAFVKYRQDKGGGQGYTFGKPTNIITYTDPDMFPTVAHEIAHCYSVGDEYGGGSLYLENSQTLVNLAPDQYTGRDYVEGTENIKVELTDEEKAYWMSPKQYKESLKDEEKKGKINEAGEATTVYPTLHPYSLKYKEFITWVNDGTNISPTISYMGSGYKGSYKIEENKPVQAYYYTSSVIWEHLFKKLLVQEKSEPNESNDEQQNSDDQSNAEVYEEALNYAAMNPSVSGNSIFDEKDFYFDEDCRFGESRMLEVSGWLVKKDGKITVEMDPMFSYDGDLEFMDTDDILGDKKYTFAAIGEDGKIINAEEDGLPAVTVFNGNFFIPASNSYNNPVKKECNEINFNFDTPYPEGTVDLVIFEGELKYDKKKPNTKYEVKGKTIWKASKEGVYINASDEESRKVELSKTVEGELAYADINEDEAFVQWDVYYPAEDLEAPPYMNENKDLYTEVFYYPEGDDGEGYYIKCSDDEDWVEGEVTIDLKEEGLGYTKDAYVWIKVTNGVNACDIFSDELDVSITNSQIALSGAGVKFDRKAGKEGRYVAPYTGAAIMPNVSVKALNPETGRYTIGLVKDQDYKVSYEKNIKSGTAKVIVEGIGVYAGRNTMEFDILAKKISGTPSDIPDIKYAKPESIEKELAKHLSVVDNLGNELVYGVDFYTTYEVDKKAFKLSELKENSDEDIEITTVFCGKGNYAGTLSKKVKFKVLYGDVKYISDNSITFTVDPRDKTKYYTGKPIKARVKVTINEDGKVKGLKSKYYKVLYSNNRELGKARVTIVGKNGYVGIASDTFEIVPKKVGALSISGVKDQQYTGKSLSGNSLPIVVKAGGILLKEGIDYTVSISGNTCDVTDKAIVNAKMQPVVKVTLIKDNKTKKSSMRPKVEWNDSAIKKNKTVAEKKFKIVSAKLNSNATTAVTLKSVSSNTVIDKLDGKPNASATVSCNMVKASKEKGKPLTYQFVINGTQNKLYSTADVTKAITVSAMGKALNLSQKDADGKPLFKIAVSTTKSGKVGKITIKYLGKDKKYSGTRTIKFMYIQDVKSEE